MIDIKQKSVTGRQTMIPKKIESIMQALLDNGHEAYIVGGAVRDMMLCEKPSDYDIFTDATGDEILSIFPEGKVVGNKDRQEKILTVVVNGIEVSQYRSNGDRTETGVSLEKHLSTCDLTINAMAMGINGKIIDNHYGMHHLRNKDILCVGDPKDRIDEDKLRALRAIRFAVKYDFQIEKSLSRVIYDTDISDLPVERVREELLKCLMYPGALYMLEHLDLMRKIVPEFEPSFLMGGGGHHDETVDEHMYNAQNIACGLTDNPILIFACAFHDIGKPSVQKHKEDGGVSYNDHEKVGAEMIRDIMQRMKFSNADTKFVEALVAEHMFGWNRDASDKTFIKHFRRLEDAGVSIEDYMVMQYSDHQANMKNPRVKFGDYINKSEMYKKWYALRFSSVPFRVSDLEVSGGDLIKLGIPVGPKVGNILNEIFNVVVNGNLKNERHVLMHCIRHRKWSK